MVNALPFHGTWVKSLVREVPHAMRYGKRKKKEKEKRMKENCRYFQINKNWEGLLPGDLSY